MAASDNTPRWLTGTVTLFVWALAMASVTFWVLRLSLPKAPAKLPVPVAMTTGAAADPAAMARLLGEVSAASTDSPAPAVSSRFVLLGVVADRSRQGAALIAVDGKPGKPYRVGSSVDEGLVLRSVEPRRVYLAPVNGAGPEIALDMPPKLKPAGS